MLHEIISKRSKKICDRGREKRRNNRDPQPPETARSFTSESAEIWATALQGLSKESWKFALMLHMTLCHTTAIYISLQGLSEESWKFALIAAHDSLPHNSDLHLWKEKNNSACTLCRDDSEPHPCSELLQESLKSWML